MNKRVILVADLESTGLDPEKGEIVQIAARAIHPASLDDHFAGSFNIILKPKHPDKIEQGALDVIGPALWEKAKTEGIDQKVGLQQFYNFCLKCSTDNTSYGKPMIAGHNIKFDIGWFTNHFVKYGIIKDPQDVPWHYNSLDSMTIAFLLFESDPMVRDFRLDTFLAQIGMAREGKHHGAVEDVNLTTQAIIRSLKFFRDCRRKMKVIK